MYFLYLKSNGEIVDSIHFGQPSQRVLNKEINCELGSGIKWENVDLFYAPDDEFPEDFQRWADTGKFYVESDEIKENFDWIEPERRREWP